MSKTSDGFLYVVLSIFFFFLTANFTRDKSVRYMCQNEEVQAP